MRPVLPIFVLSLALTLSAAFQGHSQPVANQAASVTDLRSVPDGNYLLTLEIEGKPQRLNLLVRNNRAQCVNSSDPGLKSVQAQFRPQASGVFIAMLQGGDYRASQIWIFRADGAAAVREVPDRGEQQSAVPVKGNSLEVPAKK